MSESHLTVTRPDGSKVIALSPGVKQVLESRFRTEIAQWPMELGRIEDHRYGSVYYGMERISLYTKLELQWRLSIGSEYSQGSFATNRRDDSYISWRRDGRGLLRYGRVVVFCKCYDWADIIVIVREFKKVVYTPDFSIPFVTGSLAGLESIKHSEIVNIIGRIEKVEDGKKVTYIVRNRAETSLEVSPIPSYDVGAF